MKNVILENKKFIFEEAYCSRCGGSGRYSWCRSHGDTCFKCLGKGRILTKRGQAAQEFYRSLSKIEAKDIKIGDVLKWEFDSKVFYSPVERLEVVHQQSASLRDGVMVDTSCDLIQFKTTYKGQLYTNSKTFDSKVDRQLSQDEKDTFIKQALAYQETLTQNGTPRKRVS